MNHMDTMHAIGAEGLAIALYAAHSVETVLPFSIRPGTE